MQAPIINPPFSCSFCFIYARTSFKMEARNFSSSSALNCAPSSMTGTSAFCSSAISSTLNNSACVAASSRTRALSTAPPPISRSPTRFGSRGEPNEDELSMIEVRWPHLVACTCSGTAKKASCPKNQENQKSFTSFSPPGGATSIAHNVSLGGAWQRVERVQEYAQARTDAS